MNNQETENFWNQSPEKQLEELRSFGEGYRHVIEMASGARTDGLSGKVPSEIRRIESAMSAFVVEQTQKQSEKNLDAAQLLEQVFTTEEDKQLIHENTKHLQLEVLSNGIFAVRMPPLVMYKLRKGAQAVAVKIPKGISFLMLQEIRPSNDSADEEFARRYREENIPHETHHLIWSAVMRAGHFSTNEQDQDVARTFQLFRDELLARATSNGSLAGYTHIHSLQPDARAELEARFPGKADSIIQTVADFNDFLGELNTAINKNSRVSKLDAIKIAVESRNFVELRTGLNKLQSLCQAFPNKEEDSAGAPDGWSVSR